MFQNVLASPADLGLLPPRSTYDKELDDFLRQGCRQTKKIRMKRQEKRSRNNNEIDRDRDTGLEMIINENNKKKHLFDLP